MSHISRTIGRLKSVAAALALLASPAFAAPQFVSPLQATPQTTDEDNGFTLSATVVDNEFPQYNLLQATFYRIDSFGNIVETLGTFPLSGAAANPSIPVGPQSVTAPGATFFYRLVVTDTQALPGGGPPTQSNQSDTGIFISNVNRSPQAQASASPGTTVPLNTLVTLTGSATDPDGTIASVSWAPLGGAPAPSPTGDPNVVTFTPTVPGTYRFRYTAFDNEGASASADVEISVANQAPVAQNGNASVTEDTPQLIQLTSTDVEGNARVYSVVTGPSHGTLSSITGNGDIATVTYTPSANYFGPDSFTFKVNDGQDSNTATISITVTPVNDPPVANAGPNAQVSEAQPYQLNGTASSDPDGNPLSYFWSQTAGTPVLLSNPNSVNPSFTAPTVTANTPLTFRLTVNDGNGGTDSDSVVITVLNAVSDPPTVVANSTTPVVNPGALVTLNAVATDPDGDPLTYEWEQTIGTSVIINGANSPTATFTAPSISASPTSLTFRVSVNDGRGNIRSALVVITVIDPSAAASGIPLIRDLKIFPSPFRPSTGATIRFTLRSQSDVRILISDVFGRQVREFTASGTAGDNDIGWDGRNGEGDEVGNGAYLVQVFVNDGLGATGKKSERVGVRK